MKGKIFQILQRDKMLYEPGWIKKQYDIWKSYPLYPEDKLQFYGEFERFCKWLTERCDGDPRINTFFDQWARCNTFDCPTLGDFVYYMSYIIDHSTNKA